MADDENNGNNHKLFVDARYGTALLRLAVVTISFFVLRHNRSICMNPKIGKVKSFVRSLHSFRLFFPSLQPAHFGHCKLPLCIGTSSATTSHFDYDMISSLFFSFQSNWLAARWWVMTHVARPIRSVASYFHRFAVYFYLYVWVVIVERKWQYLRWRSLNQQSLSAPICCSSCICYNWPMLPPRSSSWISRRNT